MGFQQYSYRSTSILLYIVLSWLLVALAAEALSPVSGVNADSTLQVLPVVNDHTPPSGQVVIGLRNAEVRASRKLANLTASVDSSLILSAETRLDIRGIAPVRCDDPAVPGLQLNVIAGTEIAVAEALSQHPDVLFAVPNWPVHAADRSAISVSNSAAAVEAVRSMSSQLSDQAVQEAEKAPTFEITDPLYLEYGWYMQQIKGQEALAEFFSAPEYTGKPIQVAIIDSGIDSDHPEFTGRLLRGYNFRNEDQLPEDDYGHGTHVAGLIGAAINNGLGVAGLAPNVVIAPYKTLDRNGSGTILDVVQAVCRAVDDGADIINLSLTSPSQNTDNYSPAFAYAHEHGVLMIAAAGNSSQARNMWPARLPEVMGIAATNIDGVRASYSSPGDDLDLAAPGGEFEEQILSTWPSPSEVICSTTSEAISDARGGSYCNSIGTSMSAALVSGVAAVLMELHPSAAASDIREILRKTAQPLESGSDEVGVGLLDAHSAIMGAMRSQLLITPMLYERTLPRSAPPFTVALALENPSLEALDWRLTYPTDAWIDISDSSQTGTVRLGDPDSIDIRILPTDLDPGFYRTPITVVGFRENGGLVFQTVQMNFTVQSEPEERGQLYLTSERNQNLTLPDRSDTYSTTLAFTNLGAETLSWAIELNSGSDDSIPWIQVSTAETGSVAYREDIVVTLTIAPQLAQVGQSTTIITLRAQHQDSSESIQNVQLNLEIIPSLLLPLIFGAETAGEPGSAVLP